MITQEMEEFAAEAIVPVGAASLTWHDAQRYAEAAVRAVYPLIRQQVIAECAAVCDGLEGMFTQKLENSVIQTWRSPKDCAAAIRSLKDKTDEAQNG